MSKLEGVKKEITQYDYVRLSLCDLNGTYRGQLVAGRHAASYLDNGLGMFEGFLLAGPRTEQVLMDDPRNNNAGNMLCFPDVETLRPVPWVADGVKVAEMLCEPRWKKGGVPQEACPRYVARKQLNRLDELGCKLYSGYEIEFRMVNKETLEPVFDGEEAYCQRTLNKYANILLHFDKNFRRSNIDVERYHPEFGPGMFEAVTRPKYGIECPDMALNLKQGLMEMSDSKNVTVTFMSKPDNEKTPTGIGAHFNFSLWNKSGDSLFYDAVAPDNLSLIAKQWIAGIMKHSRALCAFTSPTVNCYRRLHQPYFPSTVTWGIEDRGACFRIKNDGPSSTYIENRLPSGKSNPYLIVASTIAAGLDGVMNELECPPPGQRENAETLPNSLSEALVELEQDEALVDALGSELVTWFVKCKRVGEIAKYKDLTTDEERFALEKEVYFL
ncbi:glutamine synthetase-like [Haliotis rubra]|uniref:glutamine synthetase-like n=1 Tax=Haliotis rubra TaxID=36100 RepID=UPI001EE4F1C2|nr:glutamine synthetase-like [Haliotis rubra]